MNKLAMVRWIILTMLVPKACLAAEFGDAWSTIEIHGFISQGFLHSDRNNFYAETEDGTFQFNEFGINFATDLTDHLRAGIQLLSRDLGEIGNNTIEIDWAFGDYRWRDWLGLRAGRIKVPWGFYNETRDIDLLRTNIFLPPSLYAEEERDAYTALQGIGLYGNLPLKALGELNYQIIYGGKDIDPKGGTAREEDIGFLIADFLNFEVKDALGGSVEWETPLEGLRLRISIINYDLEIDVRIKDNPYLESLGIPVGTYIHYEEHNETSKIFSVEYGRDKFVLAAEYLNESGDDGNEGYYGSITYRFTDWFEFGAYYSVYYEDKGDKEGKTYEAEGEPDYRAWQKEFVLTSRIDIEDRWTFKLEGHFITGAANMLWIDNPDGFQEDSFLFAAKTTFHF